MLGMGPEQRVVRGQACPLALCSLTPPSPSSAFGPACRTILIGILTAKAGFAQLVSLSLRRNKWKEITLRKRRQL